MSSREVECFTLCKHHALTMFSELLEQMDNDFSTVIIFKGDQKAEGETGQN